MTNNHNFEGFSKECVNFLAELRNNNNRPWFEEHKNDFNSLVQSPAKEFGIEMAKSLESISPSLLPNKQVYYSLFRIYRDLRFSRDKTPHKTHLGIWFWKGEKKKWITQDIIFILSPPI